MDIDSNLPELLQAIHEVKGDFRIRLGMMNPFHAGRFLKDERMYKFLHIPLIGIVERFKKEFQELTVSTDALIKKVQPNIVNITRFSPRPRTEASKLKDLPDRIKKDRSRKISLQAKHISGQLNKRCIGSDVEVLVTEEGKNGTFLGRTNSYQQVVLTDGILGGFKKVRIWAQTPYYLIEG